MVLGSFSVIILLLVFCFTNPNSKKTIYETLFHISIALLIINFIIGAPEDGRTGGIFNQANVFGNFATFISIFSLGVLNGKIKINKNKNSFYFLFIISLLMVFFSGSFTSIFVYAISTLVILMNKISLVNFIKLPIRSIPVLVLGLYLLMYSDVGNASPKVRSIKASFQSGNYDLMISASTLTIRNVTNLLGIQKFISNPFLGNGIEGRSVLFQRKIWGVEKDYVPHNALLVIGMQLGILGIILCLYFYYYLYFLIKSMNNERSKNICQAIFISMVIYDMQHTMFIFMSLGNVSFLYLILLFTNTSIDLLSKNSRRVKLAT